MAVMFPDLLEDFKKTGDEIKEAMDVESSGEVEADEEEEDDDELAGSSRNDSGSDTTGEDSGGGSKVPCEICFKNVSTSRLKSHMKLYHSNTTGYPCTICGKKFAMAQTLNWHHMCHMSEKKDVLKAQQTSQSNSLAAKQRFILPKPTPEEVLENLEAQDKTICPICERAVPKKTLHSHIDTQHAYLCKCCAIVFATPEDRAKHVSAIKAQRKILQAPKTKRVPTYMEKVKCDICGKEVTRKRLESHKIVYHFKNGKFPCTICRKRFLTQRDLDRHVSTHKNDPDNSGNDKIPCDVCSKVLTKRRLEDHKIRFHSKYSENYSCKNCGKKFVHLADLDIHLSTDCTSNGNVVEEVTTTQQIELAQQEEADDGEEPTEFEEVEQQQQQQEGDEEDSAMVANAVVDEIMEEEIVAAAIIQQAVGDEQREQTVEEIIIQIATTAES